MRHFYNILDMMSSKKIMLFISVVIICHLIWQIGSLHQTYSDQSREILNARMERVFHLIVLMKETPPDQRFTILNDAAPYSIFERVSLTMLPQWRVYSIANTSLPIFIEDALREDPGMSMQIQPGQWLNVRFQPALHIKWLKLILWTVFEIASLSGLLLFFLVIHYFNRSLLEFKQATDRLGMDLKIMPLSVKGPLVMKEVVKAINDMQQRIQTLIVGRTRILAAISHDLRTPITRMQLRTQFLLDPELQQSFQADLEEMHIMVKETLAFAKDDTNIGKKINLDLVSLLSVICDEAVEIGRNVVFSSKIKQISFLGNTLSLRRAFNNLIDNAVRYGKKAEVRLFTQKQFITIEIKDNGPGIQESEMGRVFLPFFRGSAFSSESGLPGTGLGLAIAYDIVQAHGGKIQLKNLVDGLRVRIQFSLHAADSSAPHFLPSAS